MGSNLIYFAAGCQNAGHAWGPLFRTDDKVERPRGKEREPNSMLKEDNSSVVTDDKECCKSLSPGILEKIARLWNKVRMRATV